MNQDRNAHICLQSGTMESKIHSGERKMEKTLKLNFQVDIIQ